MCHIPLESFLWRLKIYFKPHLNQSLHTSYGPPKLQESQFTEFRDFNLEVLNQNDIWMLALWLGTKNNRRGKVVASPILGHDEFCEFVFTRGLSIHKKCFNYTLTNLLFDLCRSMWVIDLLVTLLSPHPGVPTRPSTPKVLWTKERAPIPYPFVVFILWTHSWIHQWVWGCVKCYEKPST